LAVSGFVLLDKIAGETSFKALFPLKRVFSTKRVGHAGTLDLRASGLIIAAMGRATRMLPYVEAKDKCYTFRLHLGYETDTLEWDGDVIEQDDRLEARGSNGEQLIDRAALEAVLPQFIGDIDQVPPKYCAVKIDGHRASDLMERGRQVELKARRIHIESLKILDSGHQTEGCSGKCFATFDMECECSKGTYIRALGRDIAKALGTCGCVSLIRRHRIGNVNVSSAVLGENVNLDSLLRVDQVLDFPVLKLNDDQLGALRNGNWVPWRTPVENVGEEGLVFVADSTGEIHSCCNYEPGRIKPKFFLGED